MKKVYVKPELEELRLFTKSLAQSIKQGSGEPPLEGDSVDPPIGEELTSTPTWTKTEEFWGKSNWDTK